MAYKQISPTYECSEPMKEFILDNDSDVGSLPSCGAGSTAVSVASGNVYMKNASGEWKVFGGGE